jgi:hypothetical protein
MRRSTGALLLVGVVAATAVGGWILFRSRDERPDDRIARETIVGAPVGVLDIIGPDPAPDANGFAELAQAVRWMDEHKGAPETWTVVGPWRQTWKGPWYESLSDGQRREQDAFFADATPFFDLVAAALAKPRLRTPPAADPRVSRFNSDPARWRVAQVLAARATAATKDVDRLDAVESLCKLAARWENRSSGDLGGAAQTMIDATTAIRRSLWSGDIDAAKWRAHLDGPLNTSWLARYGQAVRMQRAALLRVLRIDAYSKPTGSPAREPSPADLVGWVRMGEDLRSGEEIAFGSPSQLAQLLRNTERLETAPTDSYPRLEEQIREADFAIPKHEGLNYVSPHVTIAAALVRTDAACRLAQVALAASEHRAKRGDFPATLDELKAAFPNGVPRDPYMDEPFRYERTDAGVRIASSGRPPWWAVQPDDSLREDGMLWELKR